MRSYTLSTGNVVLSTTNKPNPLQIEGTIKSIGIYVYADISIYNLNDSSINSINTNNTIKLEVDGVIIFEGKINNFTLANKNNFVDKVFTIYCFSDILHKKKYAISKKQTTAQNCLTEIIGNYNNNLLNPFIKDTSFLELVDQTSQPIVLKKFNASGNINQIIDKLTRQLNYDPDQDAISTQVRSKAITVCVKKQKIIVTDNSKSIITTIPVINIINGSVAFGIASVSLECLIIPDISIDNLVKIDFNNYYNLQNAVNLNLVPIQTNQDKTYIVKSFVHNINYYDSISTTSLELLIS